MPQRANPEKCGTFYSKYAAQLEECLYPKRAGLNAERSCKEVVKAAREELGYSMSTSAIDIISPLRRGYKQWKAAQAKGPDGGPL